MDDFKDSRELFLLLNEIKLGHEETVRLMKATIGKYPPRSLSERITDICITVDDMLDDLEARDDSALIAGRFELEELRGRLREWVPADECPIGESLERQFRSLTSWAEHTTLHKLRQKVYHSRAIQEVSRKLESLEVLSKQRGLSDDESRGAGVLKRLLAHHKEQLSESQ